MIDVKEFGALGDGRSKDTEVIQQALNTGRMLYFPPPEYICRAPCICKAAGELNCHRERF